ncbi:MAG: InlB B-repeat-containing protein [Clostridia bacterium]|nr:InlB B-repeat-containing protein [Clostridia bacterium]
MSEIPAGSTGDVTVTATWEVIDYAIEYVLNGGTNATGNPTTYNIESGDITFAAPTREGYTFKGWSVSGITSGDTGDITTSAKWEIINYTIEYVLGGGINNYSNPSTYNVETDTIIFADPIRTGYIFKNWSVSQIQKGHIGNVTTTAVWEAESYAINYVLNGGTNAATNPATYTIESGDITFAAPTKNGYTFKGWSVSGITAGTTGEVTTSASWEVISYTITYVLNGGNNNVSNPETYTIEDTITFAAPTKNGYTFKGWSVNGVTAGTTGAITTTATWEAIKYAITYVLNGGTNVASNPATYTIEDSITFATPTKNGYTFKGWSVAGIPAGTTGAITTTATWEAIKYAITYVLNGGTNASSNPATYTIESSNITFAAPTKNGYTFKGWSVSGITAGTTGAITTTASWEAIEYSITYVLNGGTNASSNPTTYTVESSNITFAAPTKNGYTFKGWSVAGITSGNTGAVTTTASWEAVSYTITYVLNGGTNATGNPTSYTIESETITFAAPTKTGYIGSWNPATIPQGSTGNKTITAVWTDATPYNITYNLNGGTNNPENPTTYKVSDATITFAEPTRSGYTFKGWTPATIPQGSTGDKVITASWEIIRYTITYNLNGGTNNPNNPASYTVEDSLITFAAPTKDGYRFDGWSKTSIAAGSTGNVTTTANFTAIFTVSGSKITGLTNYGKTLDNVTIPEKIDGNNITEIADYAFEGNSLTQITFSKKITKIGTSAFLNCDSLTDVNYLGTVSDWCAVSFADKYSNPIFYAEDLIVGGSLLSGTVNVPTTVTSVGNYAFYGYTGISGVNFGTSGKLNSIGDYSFYGCINLESATFPTSFKNDNIGLYAFYGTLINIDYIYVDTSDVNVQYVVLMMSNSTCDEIETYLESMKNTFGTVNASSASRIYAFGVAGPFALNNTVETMKNTVDRSFELAEKYNIPVYFRMDDSSQYFTSSASGIAKFKNEVNCEHVSALDGNYYEHFYDDPDMCEWIALPTSTQTWGGEQYGKLPKAVSNYGGSYAHVVGGFPCFNSESYLAWYDKQVNDGFIYPLTENLRRLKKLGKEYLFAGVAAGYETSIPNYSTDAVVTPGGNYSALESFEKAQFGMHAIYNITDEYGNKLYPDDAALTAGAERHGLSLAAFKRYLLVQVVHDYIEHTCKLFYDAGISKNKIFSHINAVASTNGGDEFSASAGYYNDAKIDTVALPTWVAVNNYSIPGYTMVSGSYNLTTIGNSVAKYGNGINAYANVKSNASDAGSNQTGIKSYFTSTLCANTKLITVENFESYSNSNFTAITKQWMNKQISSGYTFANRAALTYPEYSSGAEPVFPIGAIGGVAYGTNTYWNYLQSTNNAFYVHGGSGGVEFTFALKDMATITGYDSTAVISIGPDANANAFQIGLMINGDTGYVYGSYLVGTNVLIGYDTPTILGTHSTNGYLTFKIAFKIVDGVWNILFNDVSIDSTLFGANTGATFMTSNYTTNIAINSNAAINIALLSSIGFSTSSGEGGTIDPVTGAIILSPGNTYNAASANGALLTVGTYGFKFRMGVKLTEELASDHFKNITVSVGPETDLSNTSAAGHFQIAFMVNGQHNKVFATFVDNTGAQKSQWVEVASLTTSDYAYFTVAIVGTTAGTWEIRIGDAMIDEGYFSSNPGGAFKNASNQLNVIIADAADTKAQVSIDEFSVYSTAVAPSSGSSGTGVTLGTLNPGEQYGNIITTGNYGFQMRVGAKLAQSLNQGENTIAIFNFGPDSLADMSTAGHFRLILMFNQENGNIMFVSYISNTGSDAAPDAPFTPIANAVLNTSDFVYFTLGIVYNTSTARWEVQINGTAVDGGKFNTLTGGGFKSSSNAMGIVVNNPANTKAIISLDNYVGVN